MKGGRKMNKQVLSIIGIALVVAVVASIITANITGSFIRVNSRRDRIDSTGPLTLSSQAGFIKLEGDTTLTKRNQLGEVQFLTNDEGSLTIFPKSGYVKLLAALTLSGDDYEGGVVLESNEAGSLTIIPKSGATKLESSLTVTNLATSENETRNAYVCVDADGKLFRSLTACR